ncbi:MAG TPA: HEAT repeat domain-containing protein [Polyangiaceae bacterium]
MRGRALFAFVVLSLSGTSGQASAQARIEAPSSATQRALSIAFEADKVVAVACAKAPCGTTGGLDLKLPAEVMELRADARLMLVRIGTDRRALVLRFPEPSRARAFEAVVAAPPAGDRPLVVFSGWTGLVEGVEGEREGDKVVISEPDPRGVRRIVVGRRYEAFDLCGREALVSPRVLDPVSLTLKPAKMQQLPAAERNRASVATVAEAPETEPPPAGRWFRAVAASSAIGAPAALTDGNPETSWSEDRGGDGRGEFVVMQGPREVSLRALELTLRPPTASVEHGVAPRHVFIATEGRVVRADLPANAWDRPGARFRITLPEPLASSCWAIVLDEAPGVPDDARVTLSEVWAAPALDVAPAELVEQLKQGGEQARRAKEMLAALGAPGFEAVTAAFAGLPASAQLDVFEVLSRAPCGVAAPTYAQALGAAVPSLRTQAQDRLRRCGAQAADALAGAVEASTDVATIETLLSELAPLAPARTVGLIGRRLDQPDAAHRRRLRAVLAGAARTPAGRKAAAELLAGGSTRVAIDILRALSPRLEELEPQASAALDRLLDSQASFRTRYLTLEPLAALSRVNAAARERLNAAFGAGDARLRARAARLVADPAEFQGELVRALSDPAVRVREAAALSLARPGADFAAAALIERLRGDDWPLVRAAAAQALGALSHGGAVDRELIHALEDPSPHVRAPAAAALGQRRALSALDDVQERLEDRDEDPRVRAAAARALGRACDQSRSDILTDYARRYAGAASKEELRVARAALDALATLGPPDMKSRLSPLLGPEVIKEVRDAAERTLASAPSCRR